MHGSTTARRFCSCNALSEDALSQKTIACITLQNQLAVPAEKINATLLLPRTYKKSSSTFTQENHIHKKLALTESTKHQTNPSTSHFAPQHIFINQFNSASAKIISRSPTQRPTTASFIRSWGCTGQVRVRDGRCTEEKPHVANRLAQSLLERSPSA